MANIYFLNPNCKNLWRLQESICMQLQEVRGKRPFKIWDSSRNVRKGLVVTSFEELLHRGQYILTKVLYRVTAVSFFYLLCAS